MKESWIMVTEWKGKDIIDQRRYDLVKRVNEIGKKASILAHAYEIELNEGNDYSIDTNLIKVLQSNGIHYTTCAIPWSQAREYTSFMKWNCNKDF